MLLSLSSDAQEEQGGAGVYNSDVRKLYDLKDPAWKYDIMPEIIDGHNVSSNVVTQPATVYLTVATVQLTA